MFGIGGPELAILVILGGLLFGRRLPQTIRALKQVAQHFAKGLREQLSSRERTAQIDLITDSRDLSMTNRIKKFLWSPAFWAMFGIIGCTTGVYFQRVAANGTGLWCLGLMFLGAAYLEHYDL
jgi:Sec-independent protein translocase protein TatA